jgi:hypothetical protein
MLRLCANSEFHGARPLGLSLTNRHRSEKMSTTVAMKVKNLRFNGKFAAIAMYSSSLKFVRMRGVEASHRGDACLIERPYTQKTDGWRWVFSVCSCGHESATAPAGSWFRLTQLRSLSIAGVRYAFGSDAFGS